VTQTRGNKTHAARVLGISVRTLRNKLNEYRITDSGQDGPESDNDLPPPPAAPGPSLQTSP